MSNPDVERRSPVTMLAQNNAMEAEGMSVVQHALECDGRLTFIKCFEGARADFVVHDGDENNALGVQLKTTRFARQVSAKCRQYAFSDTAGYQGLAVLCIALDSRQRMWLIPGGCITSDNVRIPVEATCKFRRGYVDHETFELDLADDFLRYMSSEHINLAPVNMLVRPTSVKGQTEFDAYQRLTAAIPLNFQPADIEGSHHDCSVNGSKWQLKLACYIPSTNRYMCTAQKQNGRCSGKRKHSQYAAADFDFLCVQMPANLQRAYLIPMAVLIQRRLAGRSDCTTATVHFYPHRKAQKRSAWVENFSIDLSSPRKALADYENVIRENAAAAEPCTPSV